METNRVRKKEVASVGEKKKQSLLSKYGKEVESKDKTKT